MRIRVLRRKCFLFLLLMFAVGLQAMATESREGNLIAFADANVKAICVANWDTDGDGELSFEEAAAVTDLGSAFQSNESITSFDELQYFTGLTSIGIGAFSGCANLSSVVIPNTVTSIGEGAFEGCTSLVSIEIPNLVTSIGDYAFAGCDNLNSIVLPETLISIGSYAFMTSGPDVSSELTSITIPNMVTSIGDEAFAGLGLTSITIPSSVTSIGINPFEGCTSLETITVETGNQVYDSRDNCNAIIETATNTLISGCQSTIIPNTVTSIGVEAFAWSGLTSIIIPNTVTSIGEGAFEGCTSLVSIEIPNSVTSIGFYAFEGCSGLTSVTIPNSVTSIGIGAFSGCANLSSVVIPNSVTSIGDYAFAESGFTSITIPNSVTSIGDYAFAWSGLTTITVLAATPPTIGGQAFQDVDKSIPVYVRSGSIDLFTNAEGWNEFTNFIALTNIEFADANVKALCVANWDTDGNGELSFEEAAAVTDLGAVFQYNEDIMSFDELQYFTGITSVVFENGGFAEGCFIGCPNLTSLTLPSSVTAIGDYAFYECTSLTSINIPNSVTAIGESAFEFAGLTAVNIPNSVTSIGISAFNGCESLVSATIPDALTTIEENVFGGCSSLTSINIPGSVTSIGDGAFSWCIGLASMTVNATTPPVLGGTSVFDEVDKSIPVYVPGGTTNAYRAAEGWDEFFNYIETSIFFADANVKQICVANWDTDGDGELSFEEAAAVTDLSNVFQDNTEITSFDELQYFTGLTSIGDEAFGGCTSLVSIEIPNSVTGIGNFSFTDCSSLNTIVIPASVTTIGIIYPFAGCNSLESITVEEGNMVYDSRDNCNAIIETATNTLISGCQNTIIPNAVTNIGMGAFAGCSNLTSIIIPNSVTSIGDFAFAGCTNLTSMIIFNTNVEMGNDVFDDITIPETLFVSASASPADGGGLFGLSQGGGGSAFVGTLVNELSIEFASQGSGEIPSNKPVLLMAKPNEGWQFVGWQINGELVSDEAFLMFRAFGEFAFEALFEPCGAEPEPELLSGRFSVSDCSTIGFARSNTIMSMTDLNMLEAAAIGVAIPGLHYEIGENQWDRMTYDASALNGNDEAYQELLLTGVDIFPSFFLKNNIDCWHIPTWREWDYMLNQRQTTSGVRYAYAKVNDVCGLVVLPDDWNATTYAFSNPNEVAGYENNNITANQWTTVLEPAGAVFLPANGYMAPGQLIQETSDGQAVGAYPGLLFSPSGEFMMGQMEGFPMTGPMTLMLDMMTMAGMMNSSSSVSFGGTSVRLAKAMDNSTATIVLATNDAERGTVTGGGEFACQQECTVTATANDGYVFMYWLENGVAISVDPEYSFKLLGDRNLTAVFAPVDEVCQINIETTVPSGISFELEWLGVGLSLSFDDGTPPYNIPFGTSPESLDFLEILQLMQSMQSGNTNTNYTFTVNILRGSNVSLDVWMPEDMINLMMGSGGSISDLGLTFTVSYVDGATIVENSSELPYNFLCNCADITLLVDPEEGGYIETDDVLNIGETVTLTAVANYGYTFVNWTFNGVEVSTEPSFIFEVTEPGALVAHFELQILNSLSDDFNDGVIAPELWLSTGNNVYEEDGLLKMDQNVTDQNVSLLSVPMSVGVDNKIIMERSFMVHKSNNYAYPGFAIEFNGDTGIHGRPLNAASWDGTTTNTSGVDYIGVVYGHTAYEGKYGIYVEEGIGDEIQGTRLCDAIFDTWLAEIVVIDLSAGTFTYYLNDNYVATVEMPELAMLAVDYYTTIFSPWGWYTGHQQYMDHININITEERVITVTADPSEGGTVTGGGNFNFGENCTVSATANEGYAFSNWMENGEIVSTDAIYSFTVTGARNLVAMFLPTYVITVEANNAAYGTVTGGGTYMEGETCTVTATPAEGYVFSAWTEDGVTVSTDAIYGFTVESARNLVAVFLPTYVITAEANNAAYGTVTGGGTYVVNKTCTVTASPAEGYEFVNWTENGEVVSTEAEYAFTVTGDRSLVANFVLKNYDILATSNPSEGGMVSGAGNYNHFETCTLVATANEGYTFINWTLDGAEVSTEPSYTFTVTGGGAYVANFMLNSYTITASANPSEGGTVSGAGDYNHFETCTLTATASEGYDFDNWTLDGAVVGTEPTYIFTVTGPAEYVANFSLKSYYITATVTPSGAGTVTGTGTYYHGSQCTLTAIANEGYAFNNWMENGEVVSTDATYAFTVTGEHSLVAAFLPTYVITAEANNAAYGTVTGGGTYEEGETCTVTASPAEGYVFSAWTEDGETVSTDAIYGFTVESARNLVAVFLPTYVITAEANNAAYGTVTGGGTYVVNKTCTVTASPAEGYEFVNWTENGEVVSTEAEYAFTVTGDRSLVANFVLKNYDILATANPGEGGTVSGAGNYNHFETCTLVATANWGYTFINWTLDGNVVSTEPSYTFTVTGGGAYVANFMLNSYTITASTYPSEGGSVSGTGNYDHGTECTLTATANVGYTFVNWTFDGVEVGTDPTYAFTVYEEATYVANFSLNLYEITAIANPVEGGTITGAGNYYHGDECILTAIPIENYTFLYWTENGNYLSSEATYSFVATSDRSLVAIFAGNEQTMSLSPGWTWLSSYIEMEGNDGLGMLEDGLNPNGVMIKSQRDGFVSYAGGMWIGTLDGISNEKMYLVNTNEASDVTFTGPVANMMNHPITLNHNWTWMGYPSPFALDINDALANLNATEGDVVKSQSSFATYSMEDGWYGSLSTLTPGMGLMYQSHNNQPVTFNYGVGMSRALKANLTAEDNHWVPDIHAYPNNMSIMAVVELNGVELQDERYELAVFNGSECRGSARLAYVPSLHRYVAFLTVTGEDDVDLYLALYDTMTGKAYYNTTDCPNFEANAVLGSLSMPFVARFGGTTDVDEWDAPNIELYPNPVVAGHLFQMEMPAECQGARVSIVNALGAVISTTDVYDEPIILRAPAVPGVYTVRIVTDKQGTFTRKLIVNK